MKYLIIIISTISLLVIQASASEVDLNDKETLNKIKAKAVDQWNLKNIGTGVEKILSLPKSTTPYKGWAKSMHPNGELLSLNEYWLGKKHGVEIVWDENGKKLYEDYYSHGKLEAGRTEYKTSAKEGTEAQLEKVASFPDRYMGKKVYFKGVEVDGDVARSEHIDGKKFCVNLTSSRGKWFYGKDSKLVITASDHMAEAIMDSIRSDKVYPNCDVYCEISKIKDIGEMVPHAAIYKIVVYNRGGGIGKTFYK